MQLKHRILTLNSTPQNLVIREATDARNTMSVQNIMDSGYAYLGNSSVTTSNFGHKLYPGQSFTIEMASSDDLYAVGDNGVQVAIFIIDRA
jgi:hypothetical protein